MTLRVTILGSGSSGPDLREQLLKAKVTKIDAVLYTHDHADQSHGIDDLRAIAYRMRQKIPVYMDDLTKTVLCTRFNYCFYMPEGRIHPPILDLQMFLISLKAVIYGFVTRYATIDRHHMRMSIRL